jgi:hypothetical protein
MIIWYKQFFAHINTEDAVRVLKVQVTSVPTNSLAETRATTHIS